MIRLSRHLRRTILFGLTLSAFWPSVRGHAWNSPSSFSAAAASSSSSLEERDGLGFQSRVKYQQAVEQVYWKHRIWSDKTHARKPELDDVMPAWQIEAKVRTHLDLSRALETRQQAITAQQIQAEINRMARQTKRPEMLRELWAVLGNDPYLVAECLARPLLEQRQSAHGFRPEDSADKNEKAAAISSSLKQLQLAAVSGNVASPSSWSPAHIKYSLPDISAQSSGCSNDTWFAAALGGAPGQRFAHAAVWTGSEMIVWGGYYHGKYFNDGGRYDPATDTWLPTSFAGAPEARRYHAAVWTGSELLLWGGSSPSNPFNATGAGYNPMTDSWRPMSDAGAPAGRYAHTAVWTGREMIVWGGNDQGTFLTTGGRYDPNSDTWRPTSTVGIPQGRRYHTAVWTGAEMIVWGGEGSTQLNTGGRYNPYTDSWSATTTVNAPSPRNSQTAIYTGNEMIIWGGANADYPYYMNSGARYNPAGDFWLPVNVSGAPGPRSDHTAIWTGSEMIVWGGAYLSGTLNSGARYDPASNTWKPTSLSNAPAGRYFHTAIWTGAEMIVFGASAAGGGRYCASQPAANCSYSITPATAQFAASGGSASISISSPSDCQWTAASNASWITISSNASGSGNGFVTYSVSANPATNSRSGTLIVAGQSVSISQEASAGGCTYSISPTSKVFGSGGGSSSFTITAPGGCRWNATSSAAWIKIGSSGGSGTAAISFSVGPNPKAGARTGTITTGGQILTIKEKGR